ncbi:MAG: hypothetical protein GVY19_05680 [Bacteroidetes bacterium]|nr:hypothetical protein [Bacteroidota bacterium]
MKKLIVLVAIVALFLFSSCAAYVASPALGALYTDVKYPMAVTSNANSAKVGSAEVTSILGIVATGDASIDAAAKSAGITKIHHVDVHATSILGIFATYTVLVYGE